MSNSRKGYSNKKVKTSFGESEIEVPRDTSYFQSGDYPKTPEYG